MLYLMNAKGDKTLDLRDGRYRHCFAFFSVFVDSQKLAKARVASNHACVLTCLFLSLRLTLVSLLIDPTVLQPSSPAAACSLPHSASFLPPWITLWS